MKLFIIAALVVIMHVSNIKAEYFTRLYFTNADCAGFHVAFDSRNVNSTPTCTSGCTEWYAGRFYVKEVCGAKVSPLYNADFSVLRTSSDRDCTTDDFETGTIAEMCIVWETSPKLSAIKMQICAGIKLSQNAYEDADCLNETARFDYSKYCEYYSVFQRGYSVPQCPSGLSPPQSSEIPPTSNAPIISISTPSEMPVPPTSKQPAKSPTKSSDVDSLNNVNLVMFASIVLTSSTLAC